MLGAAHIMIGDARPVGGLIGTGTRCRHETLHAPPSSQVRPGGHWGPLLAIWPGHLRTERRRLLSPGLLNYNEGAWGEDRATRGRDPSADPGAETGVGGTMPPLGRPGLAQKR
jgi:hypothetical protein